jgi:membrane protein implicated in regulation of membrane protease activity
MHMVGTIFYVWLSVALLFLFMELLSPGLFFFLAFFLGALGAAGTSLFICPTFMQLIVFFIFSVCSFAVLYFWVKQYAAVRYTHRTNVSALQGKKARVLKMIMPYQAGTVLVQGQIWSAYSYDEQVIDEKSIVEVIDIKGVHLIVKKVKE